MNKPLAALLVPVAFLLVAATPAATLPAQQQIAALQQKVAQRDARIRDLRNDKADLNGVIQSQNAVLSDQSDTIQRLRTRIANTPDPLDAITTRDPDGLWQAMTAIWRAFPSNDPSTICGYDKSNAPGSDTGLSVTSYSFFRTTGC